MNKYVFADFDGTVIHSMHLYYACICEVFDSFGVKRPTFSECIIGLHHDFLSFYRHFIGEKFDQKILDSVWKKAVDKYFKKHPRLLRGAKQFLDDVVSMGYEVILITANNRETIMPQIDYHGISSYFSDIHTGHEKKADIMYEYLSQRNIGHCIMLGDSMKDLIGARENGVDFVGIVPRDLEEDCLTEFKIAPRDRMEVKIHLREQGARAVISDFSELFEYNIVS